MLVAALALVSACREGVDLEPRAVPPVAPQQNDPGFSVTGVRGWYLVGNDVTPGHDTLALRVAAPGDVRYVDLWLDGGKGIRLVDTGDMFELQLDISNLSPGEHELLLAADGSDTGFARMTFVRSHPLYVVVSNDWDTADHGDDKLRLQEALHRDHPELRMTHFVGPYTFTDPSVSPGRRATLVGWVKNLRDTEGDEIGLHIHPYCNFVETAGIDCRHEPSFVYSRGDSSGYTVFCAAYSEEEFSRLVARADELFVEAGLGKPTSFRAGGWTADLGTLRALAANDYVADTSANNWARLEEWEGRQNGALYAWNKENWASINDTSQPYYPSEDDILVPGNPGLEVLEVPDNGILVDYVFEDEMIAIFEANWSGGPLGAPVAYSIGYHPTNFNDEYKDRIHGALSHVEQYLASRDSGPVVYATLSELPRVWTR